MFEESTLIGLSTTEGGTRLNPPASTVIGADAQLILIAADDDTIRLSDAGQAPVDPESIIVCVPTPVAREATLLFGWN